MIGAFIILIAYLYASNSEGWNGMGFPFLILQITSSSLFVITFIWGIRCIKFDNDPNKAMSKKEKVGFSYTLSLFIALFTLLMKLSPYNISSESIFDNQECWYLTNGKKECTTPKQTEREIKKRLGNYKPDKSDFGI